MSSRKTRYSRNKRPHTEEMVDAIAFQGSVLALNATLQLARAGDASVEFPQVAEEVRNLARNCARAARDTACLIEHSAAVSKPRQSRGFSQIAKAISQMEHATPQDNTTEHYADEALRQDQADESEILRSLASRLTAFAGHTGPMAGSATQ